MFKLVKYELRANFLTIVGICITVIIANLLIMTKKGTWNIAVPALSTCLTIGAVIVIFIASLKIMSKYLYEDSGYLLFTLPQSGMSIIASRLITSLIQISIVFLVAGIMSYLAVTDKIDFSFFKDIKISQVIYYLISYIYMIVSFLSIVYFCMVIGKVALKGKKLGKIGSFIIFIAVSMVIGWISLKLSTLFPQTLNLNNFSISSKDILNSDFSSSGGASSMNIASGLFDILTFVGFFISTSYLIDNKLDLS
ncbi:hypothetical protein [Clostridium psychrophilum]|uniref:hypothetical protein n=1 Tax=Clostridium psychrophilum TaxID=132926 RepID=UPI001C0BBC96|nr:hypothetical protein [Clostridium psychrophilum]MBU3182001.1 hypothetical protein [Clostridium psychrophilum]